MKKVTCIIIGTDNADKKELLVRIASDLSPKKSKSKENLTEVATEVKETDQESDQGKISFRVIQEVEDSADSDDDQEDETPDSWEGEITVENRTYTLQVHHCLSIDSHQNSRKLLYLDADIFLVCFSVSLPLSLEEVVDKWVPELRSVCPVTPFILVGTHTEWREIYDPTQADATMRPVYPETGAIYAERIGAVRYMECSAIGTDSVRYIFNEAVRISTMDRMELSQLHPDYVRYGSTLLHQAVQFNHEASVEALSYVMDINVRDKAGRTPLDIALRENYVESARCLIRNGCDVSVDNDDWKKRCEFWINEDPKQHMIHRTVFPLAKSLMNWYASLQDPYRANLILIGQHAVELSNFLLKSAPFIVMKTLAIVNAEALCSLDFSHLSYSLQSVTITSCDLGGEVPSSLFNLLTLDSLALVDNGITSIPIGISKLKNLKRLRLSRNKLRFLPDAIRSLINLRFLFCDGNVLERLPDQIGSLQDLQVLDVSCNKLEKLSISLGLLTKLKCLKFEHNRLEFPPHDIVKQGPDEVLKYLNTFLDDPVQDPQVKVTLVGAEGAGKTTLVTALRFKKPTFPDKTDKTSGIEISDCELNQTLQMKMFDFCGDPSFLSSHSLFLSENSMYLVCFDMRQYTTSKAAATGINHLGRLQLWLEMIYAQAPSSHVIIVATNVGHSGLSEELRNRIREDVEQMIALYQHEHKSQFEGEPVPQCSLCEGTHLCVTSSTKFYINQNKAASRGDHTKPHPCIPHIVGYYEVSAIEQYPRVLLGSKNISLQNFKCGLSMKMIVLLNSSGHLIPQKCLYVKDRILEILNSDQELQEMPIFTLERIKEISLGCGMKDEFKIKMMLKYFHNQGEFLWFEDIPELCDTVIVKPQWLVDRLRALYSQPGRHFIDNGVLQTSNVSNLWPEYSQSDREIILSMVRGLGLSFPYSSDEIFPSLLPHGYPDKDSWPRLPSPSNRQVTVEFLFSFLPPSFFSDLMVAVIKRELVCPDLAEPSYYRYNLVFTTNLKASQGCVIHNRESLSNPLEDCVTSDQRHVIHIESIPHVRCIRATVRGPAPCCVLPEVRVAIKLVSDVHYPGVRFTESVACPACVIATAHNRINKVHFFKEIHEESNVCSKGHVVGSKLDITTGRIIEGCNLPSIRKLSVLSAAIEQGQNILEDKYCPKLFIVLPIRFKPLPFKDCRVVDHVVDGYAVHFLCECPGYWHLLPVPGYRVTNIDEFFDLFGARVAKLMKLVFMLGADDNDTITYPSLKNLLLKVAIGHHSQRDCVAENVKALVDHYCTLYPSLMQECSSFLYEDVSYLVSGKGLSRSKLARILEVTPDGHHFGPLVCTYVERHKERMWLCHKHAEPISTDHAQDISRDVVANGTGHQHDEPTSRVHEQDTSRDAKSNNPEQ